MNFADNWEKKEGFQRPEKKGNVQGGSLPGYIGFVSI